MSRDGKAKRVKAAWLLANLALTDPCIASSVFEEVRGQQSRQEMGRLSE